MSVGDLVTPALLLAAVLVGVFRRVPVYDAFVKGALSGLKTAWQVLPCLAAVMLAAALLAGSGALEALMALCAKPLAAIGIPQGALPVMLLRPVSGSAALAMLETTLAQYGADSATGRVASAMVGSSETILYTCSLYLAAAGVRKARHAPAAALLAWFAGAVAAAWFCALIP